MVRVRVCVSKLLGSKKYPWIESFALIILCYGLIIPNRMSVLV